MRHAALVPALLLFFPVPPATGDSHDRGGAVPELVVAYDFYDVGGQKVFDGSGHGHGGTLVAGEVVFGRNKPAVRFSGQGVLTMAGDASLGLGSLPFTIGAMCRLPRRTG